MTTLSERYRWHAESEFRGSSELYFDWAYGIAEDDEVLQPRVALVRSEARKGLLAGCSAEAAFYGKAN